MSLGAFTVNLKSSGLLLNSNEPGRFHGEPEVVRASFEPILQVFQLGKTVKGHVQLYRIEVLAIVLKPFSLRQLLRIKSTPPTLIIKSGTADPPLLHGYGYDHYYAMERSKK
jgi:hypothetical protein